MDPLPFARHLAIQQRYQRRLRQEHARRQITNRNADPDGTLPGHAGDTHQAAETLGDLVDAGPFAVGAILAEPSDAGIDDARIDLGAGLVVDTESMLHGRAVILDDDIRLFDQLEEYFLTFFGFEIDRQAALIAVQILKIETMPGTDDATLIFVDAVGRFDFDNIGTPVAELSHASRPRPMRRKI